MSEIRKRSTNLTDAHIDIVLSLLDGWDTSDKLTWDHLITAIDFRTGEQYTRQCLSKHTRIQNAYTATKNRLSNRKQSLSKVQAKGSSFLIERNEKLEAENERLKKENEELLSQFTRWAYNAYLKGLTIDDLNKKLPPIDKGQDE